MPHVTIVTRYDVRVHARNLNATYGFRVSVYADSRQEAVDKAVAIGWNGHGRDARVTVDLVTQEVVAHPVVDERASEARLNPCCGECRMGLGAHDTADPQCDHHGAKGA